MTKIITVNPHNIDESALLPAVSALRNGGLCAFPTETVYGLGANALNEDAVSSIFKAKGRPQDNPLIVHISKIDEIYPLVSHVPKTAEIIMEKFWGGPITIILKRSNIVPDVVTAGLDTVAIRLPSHPVANALINLSGVPIAAPSANISGRPSPTIAKHVIEDLMDRVDFIIDGGACTFGLESTVLDLTVETPTILRPGAISKEDLASEIGAVLYGKGEGAPKSPGMKYKHYAPKANVYIVDGENAPEVIYSHAKDTNIGILNYGYLPFDFKYGKILSAGENAFDYAARLFYNLREFDELGVHTVYAIAPPSGGIGDAVLNRIYKSADGKILK